MKIFEKINGKELLSLIPQSHPMVMIDKLVFSDKNKTCTELKVSKDNIFFAEGRLQEAALVENMAQTAAVRAGFEAKQTGKPVRTGFIGAIKNLNIYKLPRENQILNTTLELIAQIGDVSVVRNKTEADGKLCADAEFKIFLMD